VLEDYVQTGFEAQDGKIVLAFRRDIETRIYNTLPHHLGTLLKRHPPACPVSFVAGTQSAEMRQGGVAATRALVGERLYWIEGTHLYPMQHPKQTAELVLKAIAAGA